MNDIPMMVFKISLVIFMAGSLLDMGLRLDLAGAVRGLRDVRFVAYSLVWGFAVCPGLAYAITRVVPLDAPYALGLVLLGMAPCAPFVPMLVEKGKGDLGYTAAFMLLVSVGTVLCMPFTVPLLAKGLTASAWTIAKPLLIVVLIPMGVGVLFRRVADARASALQPLVKKLSGLAGLLFCVMCLYIYGKGLLGVAGELAVAAEVLFFVTISILTYWLGFGLRHDRRIVLSIGTTTRNLGACLVPLMSAPESDQRATLMVVLSLPIMVGVSLLAIKVFGRSDSPPSADPRTPVAPEVTP